MLQNCENLDNSCKHIVMYEIELPRPEPGCVLAGFYPPRRSRGHGEVLTANVLELELLNGSKTVIISMDTLFIDADLEADLKRCLHGEFDLVLVATHTHNAPNLAKTLQSLGEVDGEWYTNVVKKIAGELSLERSKKSYCFMRTDYIDTELTINRRLPSYSLDYKLLRQGKFKVSYGISMAPNPRGVVDGKIFILQFIDERGVFGCIWSLAAHASREPEKDKISCDFPGAVRTRLKRKYGSDCVILYFPGLAGSSTPNCKKKPWYKMTFREFILHNLPLHHAIPTADINGYQKFSDTISSQILSIEINNQQNLIGTSVTFSKVQSEGIFHDKVRGDLCLNINCISVGDVITFVFCNGELITEWKEIFSKNLSEDEHMLFSGYSAGNCLYIPTEDELRKGGYEAHRFIELFGLEGYFVEDINKKVMGAMNRCLSKLSSKKRSI